MIIAILPITFKRKQGHIWAGVLSAVFLAFAVLCAAVGIGCARVPDVAGKMTVSDANQTISSCDLVAELLPNVVWSDTLVNPCNYQSISPGTIVLKGSKVLIGSSQKNEGTQMNQNQESVSTSTEGNVPVPNVVGMEQHTAAELLHNMGLEFQVWWTEENDIEAEAYYVVQQSVPSKSQVPAGTVIKLEIQPKQ